MTPSRASIEFPRWIVESGLPLWLAGECKSPLAWLLFRTVVELDVDANRSGPGIVEASYVELAQRSGIEADKIEKLLKKLRKAGVLRCFLPDNEEEEALLQVVTPLETPVLWDEVRRATPGMLDLPDHAFRYAREGAEGGDPLESGAKADGDPRLKEVVDLYLDVVSMKMNALILDELRLIAARFDLPLVRKVFARARAREVQGLSWILSEIRREQSVREGADKMRKENPEKWAEAARERVKPGGDSVVEPSPAEPPLDDFPY